MLLDPGAKRTCRHSAAMARQFPSVADEDHCRDCLDVIAGRKVRFGFGIDLAKAQTRLELFCRFFEHRRHGAAWPAPGRPEIDEQRQIRGTGVAVEMPRIEIDRVSGEKRLMALTASATLATALGWHAVERVAMRTWNCGRNCHCRSRRMESQGGGPVRASM